MGDWLRGLAKNLFTEQSGAQLASQHSKTARLFKEFFAGENEKLLENTAGAAQAETDFLHCYKEELAKGSVPFLESIPTNPYLVNRNIAMKSKSVVPLSDATVIHTLLGPKMDRGVKCEDSQSYKEKVCAQTISTYPVRSEVMRQGDPICDRYGFNIFQNRMVCVVADGCNWGERPKVAAQKARDRVLEYLTAVQNSIQSVQDAQAHLLRSFTEAQRVICEDDPDGPGPGSTTLIAGITVEIQGEAGCPNEWAFICASVGDCKAFLIEQDTLKIRDVTMDNRGGATSDTDCGGRLGPVRNGGPDLRNLRTYCTYCQPGDLVMVVSDGVHDNLHPQMLSISPLDLKLDFTTWEDAAKVINIEEVATKYRVQCLQHFISDIPCTPGAIVEKIINHCNSVTKNSRDWMEQHVSQPLPTDYEKYPGKMDHTTCVVFRVGLANYQTCSTKYIPLSVSLYTTKEHIRLYCRTIAKGKLECFARKRSCTLKVRPQNTIELPPGAEVICDELSDEISRTVKFPAEITIDVHSKVLQYERAAGVLIIQFNRLPVS